MNAREAQKLSRRRLSPEQQATEHLLKYLVLQIKDQCLQGQTQVVMPIPSFIWAIPAYKKMKVAAALVEDMRNRGFGSRYDSKSGTLSVDWSVQERPSKKPAPASAGVAAFSVEHASQKCDDDEIIIEY